MNKKIGLYVVLGFFIVVLLLAALEKASMDRTPSVYAEKKKSYAERKAYTWYKINDNEFTPPLLVFLNGCWESESSEDVFFTNAVNGDFYFKDGLKQEVWFNDFDTMEAYYNGTKTWGGDLHRNKAGDKIRVNRINYSKVNCYNAGMTD